MRWYNRISIKLFLVCFIFVLCSNLIVSSLTYRNMKNESLKEQSQYVNQLLHKTEQYLGLYYSMANNMLSVVSPLAHGGMSEQLQQQLDSLYESSIGYVDNIYIIHEDLRVTGGNIYSKVFTEPNPGFRSIYDQSVQSAPVTVVSEPYPSVYSGWTVTFSRAVKAGGQTYIVALDMNIQGLIDELLKIGGNDDIQLGLISSRGNVIAWPTSVWPNAQKPAREMKVGDVTSYEIAKEVRNHITIEVDEGGSSTVTLDKRHIPRLDWIVLSVLKESRLKRSLEAVQSYFIFLISLGFLLSVGVAWVIARYIRNPVYTLMMKMRQVRNGNFRIEELPRRHDEFGELSTAFEEMVRQINRLMSNLNESEKLKRDMEIQVLQSQINPHFLYNTLGTISNVVDLGRSNQVDPIIYSLISILEYGISDASDKVPLEQELENVRHYLYIQNIRYDHTFEFIAEADESVKRYPVLKLILQPIVENSLFHAYCGGTVPGVIRLVAKRTEAGLVITVEDRGVGMSEEVRMNILKDNQRSSLSRNRKRIGLYNIHKRIQLHYGEAYGLEVESALNAGTTVTIRLADEMRREM